MTNDYTPLRIPESMTARENGSYMRGLREHFKLSLQDVSERLHIRVRYVQAMEEGRLDQMPGKVYARGYLHTYAEFLGLDPEQLVDQWFATEGVLPSSPAPVASGRSKPLLTRTNWRGLGIAGVMALVALLIFTQIAGRETAVKQAPTVMAVPEAMLASVRNRVKPTQQNRDCLMGKGPLSCFFSHRTMQAIMAIDAVERRVLDADMPEAEDAKATTPPEEDAND